MLDAVLHEGPAPAISFITVLLLDKLHSPMNVKLFMQKPRDEAGKGRIQPNSEAELMAEKRLITARVWLLIGDSEE